MNISVGDLGEPEELAGEKQRREACWNHDSGNVGRSGKKAWIERHFFLSTQWLLYVCIPSVKFFFFLCKKMIKKKKKDTMINSFKTILTF